MADLGTFANAPAPCIGVILCAVMETEVKALAAELPEVGFVETLRQGLHNEPDQLRIEVQAAVERLERLAGLTGLALVYGLCSRGLEGIAPRRLPVALPRAHDCITLLLGSKERYAEYVAEHPGTYWYSPGWNRHHLPPGRERHDRIFEEYVEKYGKDNAEYLMQMQQHWFQAYDRATWVDLGVGAEQQDLDYTRSCADWLDWQFDRQQGTPDLLRDLMSGAWDESRFQVIQPGQTFKAVADERIITACEACHGRHAETRAPDPGR